MGETHFSSRRNKVIGGTKLGITKKEKASMYLFVINTVLHNTINLNIPIKMTITTETKHKSIKFTVPLILMLIELSRHEKDCTLKC